MPANYVLLSEVTLAASASSVVFSNIPQTGYTDLKLVMSLRITTGTPNTNLTFTPSGGTYSDKVLYGYNTTAGSNSTSNIRSGQVNADANIFNNVEIYIPNYASSNAKSVSVDAVTEVNGVTNSLVLTAGLWSGTSAITGIVLTPVSSTYTQYSTFYLYGLAAVGTTPVIAPFATGGDIIQNDGTYWIHTFLSSGTFTPAKALNCDYLVVGGGGGGTSQGGGGGAGGFRTSIGGSTLSTVAQAYAITVGSGGAADSGVTGYGVNGTASVFSTISSAGGGGGTTTTTGLSGGSGGGGGYAPNAGGAGNTPSTSPSQGNNGGSGAANSGSLIFIGGGGGGAGATGGAGNASTKVTGAGGNGSASSITGTSVTYAGGGSGGASAGGAYGTGYSVGTAGTGGGGTGSVSTAAATSGTANTGGGGGGGSYVPSSYYASGNGGSGIVIIRYPIA
jgi:hypothetical protein